MSKLNVFIPLTKIDAEKRLVYGIATCEKKDRAGEVCDYATSKPFYEKWSQDAVSASGGKSLGNLRAMHGKVAAGKLTDLAFNDDDKQIEVCAKVVDDAEWKKVEEGVYTGFSHGGSYAKVWTDENGDKRYTAIPIELSLVDTPCLPDATFKVLKMQKANGVETVVEEERAFACVIDEPSMTEIGNRADAMAKAAGADGIWQHYTDEARTAIMQEQIDAAFAKATKTDPKDAADENANPKDKPDGKGDAKTDAKDPKDNKKDAKKPAKKFVEPTQVWKCNCAEHSHLTKSAAVTCMKTDEAKEAAGEVVAPLSDALAKLNAALSPTVDIEVHVDPVADLKKFIAGWKTGDEVKPEQVEGITALVQDDPALVKAIGEPKDLGSIMSALKKALTPAPLKKGLYTVSRFCSIISDLKYVYDDVSFEAQYEGDESDVPAQIKAGLLLIMKALQDMVVEECNELFPDDVVDVEVLAAGLSIGEIDAMTKVAGDSLAKHADALKKAAGGEVDLEKTIAHVEKTRDDLPETAKIARDQLDKCAAYLRDLSKVGARNSKKDAEAIQQIHDMATALGASCGDDGVEKAGSAGDLAKLENVELRKQLSDIVPKIETLTKQVEELRAQPMPSKARLTAVEKGIGADEVDPADAMAKRLEGMTPEDRALELIKVSLKLGTNGHPAHSNR